MELMNAIADLSMRYGHIPIILGGIALYWKTHKLELRLRKTNGIEVAIKTDKKTARG